ncbi:ABC transporter permease [Candidatus Pacearchaeota archaeon]|nr:ABC transporter permease [Candidatus Pacearchaeota archaeon]
MANENEDMGIIWKDKVQVYKKNIADFWKSYKSHRLGILGLIMVTIFILIGIFAPYIAPYDPYEMGVTERFEPPGFNHLLGGNDVGIDIFSELLYGFRVSIIIAIGGATLSSIIGTLIGVISGYFGKRIDSMLMTLTDILLIIPSLPLMILLASYIGSSVWNIILLITFLFWTRVARQVRAQVLYLKESEFVMASKSIGAGSFHIISNHILPNIAGIVIANSILNAVIAVLVESGMAFLGLGDLNQKSWGMMLYFAQTRGALIRGAWWWVMAPGICISLMGCAFTFVGFTLTDILNPRRAWK